MNDQLERIRSLLEQCTALQRRAVFDELRKTILIHPVEAKLNTRAEIILEAISKDEKGLTFRMLRGVIAEAAIDALEIASRNRRPCLRLPAG